MSCASRFLLLSLVLALQAPALAEEPVQGRPPRAPQHQGATPSAPQRALRQPVVPDSILRAAGDHPVFLHLADGGEVLGRVLSIKPDQIAVATLPDSQIISLPRDAVVQVRLMSTPPPGVVLPPPPPVPSKPRHFAINLSFVPGVNLDVDSGLFHGFLNGSLVLPMASGGSVVAFSAGGGVGIPVLRRRPSLKLDIFAYGAVTTDQPWGAYPSNPTIIALGVGLGLHHTWNNGLTLGFKLPILGYSIIASGNSPSAYPGDTYHNNFYGSGAAAAAFFLSSIEALPIGFIGYRF